MVKMIRITEDAYDKLKQLEQETGTSKQAIIDQALEQMARERFLKRVNQEYEDLKSRPEEWQEELEDRAEWEECSLCKEA